MIKITDEMRKMSDSKFQKCCDAVDRQIQKAAKEGRTRTYFACDKDGDAEVYYRVRSAYESEGYRIVPTGYIGGVWQLTEDICW